MQKLSKSDSLIAIVQGEIDSRDQKLGNNFRNRFEEPTNNQYDEIAALNRFFRRELSSLTVNTISERECLIDAIEPVDWLRHFRNNVLPTIIRFHLPRSLAACR